MYFEKIKKLNELRKQYLLLVKKYHPDTTKDDSQKSIFEEILKKVNVEYEELFEKLKKIAEREAQEEKLKQSQQTSNENTNKQYKAKSETTKAYENWESQVDETIRNLIYAIINLQGLIIEIKGCWIWISGESYQHRNILYSLGFRYCKKEGVSYWIWHPADSVVYSRKTKMEYINSTYGNIKVELKNNPLLED